ncbi:hypothetical protein FHT76_000765 [Rhizobium sp. BK176]|nr:hypothetical protein [Rhizobium sp. BK176]
MPYVERAGQIKFEDREGSSSAAGSKRDPVAVGAI